jgi:hypothetical protein
VSRPSVLLLLNARMVDQLDMHPKPSYEGDASDGDQSPRGWRRATETLTQNQNPNLMISCKQ